MNTQKNPATRFMTIKDVAAELATSESQIRALISCGDLPAIQIGGRGQWRVERSKLEEYIQRMYELTAKNLEKLPEPEGDES